MNELKRILQATIYRLTDQNNFYGSMLQEFTIKYSDQVPTAGITFNKKYKQFEIYINPDFFLQLSPEERVAVFHHEVLHFANQHLSRLPLSQEISPKEIQIQKIAADMAINQYIANLPKGCVNVKEWKHEDGSDFATFQSAEYYASIIKEEIKKNPEGKASKQMEKYKEFDQHDWDKLSEEDKQKMLEEAKKIVKRTIEKTAHGHSLIPDAIKDLLDEIETAQQHLNYKSILKKVIKKTVSTADRENTWKKPSKRYGIYSPGKRIGDLPKLAMYVDTSGSISTTELNQFLKILSAFLQVGERTCSLGLWHASLYYKDKYRLHTELDPSVVQSGGTDITQCLEDIKKCKPDLSIIFTDGYYDTVDIKITSEVLFIISEGGNKSHPMKHVGNTILMEGLK